MAVIFCGGGGNPTPTVSWHRLLPGWVVEDVVIDGRVQLADSFLLFTEVRLSDEGTYFCTLTSSLGNRTSSKTLLNVYSEQTKQIAVVRGELESVHVLTCIQQQNI